ncbi:hypothetical protein [uncultured Roseobacter sp.]|uniref:hypothetical protein n=1 Tax=uncultured Roseobacter sp. TaxID=114847 RepID=UPI002630A8E7|nr:hypothetical protein [uncultured Roseobacter sp.]
MRLILTIALLVYVVAALITNSMIVNAATYDVALVSQVVVVQLQRLSEFFTTLGLSLIILRSYVSRLDRPEVISISRLSICAGIIGLAFVVLMPVQQKAMQWLVQLAPAEMRRDALVLSVTNYGVIRGDVAIPQLEITRDEMREHPLQTLFPLLNPILLFSDGFEAARSDVGPIARTVLKNDLTRNHDLVSVGFNGAMDASCLALDKLFADYTKASNSTAKDFSRSSDQEAVRKEWFEKIDELFGEGADIVPQIRNQQEFLEHPAVQAKVHATVEENLRAIQIPNFLSALGSTDELAEYARERMSAKVTNPCAATWDSFTEDGHRDDLVDDLAAYYARLVGEDYRRLGNEGDLNTFGEVVMLYAFAPAIGLASTWLLASLQLIVALSMIARYQLRLPKVACGAILAGATGLILIVPITLRSDVELSRPGLEDRFNAMGDLWSPWGAPLQVSLRSLIRAEETVYPIGRVLRCTTPIVLFDMFGEDCEGS